MQQMAYLIERRAYELYIASGCQEGHDLENWLQAEKELTSATEATAPPAEAVAGWLLDTVSKLQSNMRLRLLAESHGLNVVSVAWEDTARTKGSCWGPNISDMTLAVVPDPAQRDKTRPMPIIRRPNFADVTTDCDMDAFSVVVGNEYGFCNGKETIPLKTYLEDITTYTKNHLIGTLVLPRDEKILTSVQACVLPLHEGSVEFNVQLYNYGSFGDSPGVLVILASSEGTSTCVVDGTTPLYFNKAGMAANFLAQRLSDDRRRRGVPLDGPMTTEEKNRNALLVFQVPLKRRVIRFNSAGSGAGGSDLDGCLGGSDDFECCGAGGCFGDDDWGDTPERSAVVEPRGFESAVLGTTEGFKEYTGTRDLALERDERFPIRCTIQYYNVTDTADISEVMLTDIAGRLSAGASSLVLNTTNRITEPSLS